MGKLLVCSGAGLSAESGITTFRDSGGLWEQHKIEDVCTLETWLENYIKVHEFYNGRRQQLAEVEPNAAHIAIAEASTQIGVINVTTNVDDLLERAGCVDVVHLHGELTRIIKGYTSPNDEGEDIGYTAIDDKTLNDYYPVKPDVIFFGEYAPKYEEWNNIICDLTGDDVVIVVGSSEQVVAFSYTLAYAATHLNGVPRMIFVNPNIGELMVPPLFEVHEVGAVEFFTSEVFTDIVNTLKQEKEVA